MMELKLVTNKEMLHGTMCYPDYGLDCRPDGECPPEDGCDDCSPYEPD